MSDNYSDPQRRPLVLVWADGTVVVDEPSIHSKVEPLRNYLMGLYTSPGDTEVPTQVLAHCLNCGRLHECKITRDARRQYIEDDWIYTFYDVVAQISPDHTDLVTTISLRVDGRA